MNSERFDILLIDDDDAIRSVMVQALSRRGFSVYCIANGKTALEVLGRHTFRLVVTDILMPGIDGLEVIMTNAARNPNLPVLAISGGGYVGDAEALLRPARHLGCQRTLAKPFEIPEFLLTIEDMLKAVPLARSA